MTDPSTITDPVTSSPAWDLLERFVRGEPVEDLEAASRQARAASERLSELAWQDNLANMPAGRRDELDRILRGERVPSPGDPEPSPCPAWCDEEDHLPERQGIDHVGAWGSVASGWGLPGSRLAQTYASPDGEGVWTVYAGDQDLTPAQAREYAALILIACELAERIGGAA